MSKFELYRPFDIDDDELSGLTSQECFVLGYELCQVDDLLSRNISFAKPIHMHNKIRIDKACKDKNKTYSITWLQEDKSESWLWLEVK
jgi:hypothetical protein